MHIKVHLFKSVLVCLVIASAAVPALAQDTSAQWMDRVTQELRTERGPQEGRDVDITATGGILYVYDTNIFLEKTNEDADSIWIPWGRVRIDYNEPELELAADLMANYKYYVGEDDERDTEVRFFGKAGYAASSVQLSLVQLLRLESDPVDAVFIERIERFVSDTLPRIIIDLGDVLAVELGGHLMLVQFDDDILSDARDNMNYRADIGLVYKSTLNLDFIGQVGVFGIMYSEEDDALGNPLSPPDVDGIFARVGIRGDIAPDLNVEALVGYTSAESDDFETLIPRDGEEHSTMDASIVARYKAQERLLFTAGYTRQLGFAGGQDPFQVINRIQAILDLQVTEQVSFRGRVLFDHIHSSLGVERDFTSVGFIATYKPLEHFIVDGGVTFRTGDVSGNVGTTTDFSDTIVQLGVAVSY